MDLTKYKKKLAKLEYYYELGSRLEQVVGEDSELEVKINKNLLEKMIKTYKEVIPPLEKEIGEDSDFNKKRLESINKVAKIKGISPEESEKELKEYCKKSILSRQTLYGYKLIKNAFLAVVYSPFSKQKALDHLKIAEDYSSCLKYLRKYIKSEKLETDIQRKLFELQRDKELSEARDYSILIEQGLDPKLAEVFASGSDNAVYMSFNILAEKYGLD